ncbi:hypothetical protein U91I_03685 [alpha proteobacterium U9-1i]|nr:hypothetical protein U91I_03685 [alpha proteobacterium U9-1i]
MNKCDHSAANALNTASGAGARRDWRPESGSNQVWLQGAQ